MSQLSPRRKGVFEQKIEDFTGYQIFNKVSNKRPKCQIDKDGNFMKKRDRQKIEDELYQKRRNLVKSITKLH